MYNALEGSASITDDDGSIATITQQTAANVTTGSTLGNRYAALLPTANPSLSLKQRVPERVPKFVLKFDPQISESEPCDHKRTYEAHVTAYGVLSQGQQHHQ
jgi:hypothetical protein